MKQHWDQIDIIHGCKREDRRAQEQLFSKYYGKLLAVSYRYISDNDSAQEVTQEGLIKIFDHIKRYDNTGSFEGWMCRIISNVAIDTIRKNKKGPVLTDDDRDFKASSDDLDAEIFEVQSLKAEEAMKAIEKLSPQYRLVFNLYVMENYSHKEIANMLGISEGTSKSNLAKAKMNLQQMLKQKFAMIAS